MWTMNPRIRIPDNVNLALVSFALAFLVWVFAKASQTQEGRLNIPVRVSNADPRIEAVINPETMPVTLRYSRDAAPYISSENFVLQVDTNDLRQNLGIDWKTISLPLNEKNLISNNVPARVDVNQIGNQRSTVEVKMRWRATPAVVEADLVGVDRLPEGYQLVTPVRVSPSEVYLVGDETALATVARDEVTSRLKVVTERINVAGRTQSALETVPIRLPKGVDIINRPNSLAEVSLVIQEVQTVREVRGVPLDFHAVASDSLKLEYNEKTANVTIFGPQSLLQQVSPNSFRMLLVRPSEELPGATRELPLEAHFARTVPEEVRSRITIRSVEPRTLKVRYVDTATTAPR